jgi:hypothetical protein
MGDVLVDMCVQITNKTDDKIDFAGDIFIINNVDPIDFDSNITTNITGFVITKINCTVQTNPTNFCTFLQHVQLNIIPEDANNDFDFFNFSRYEYGFVTTNNKAITRTTKSCEKVYMKSTFNSIQNQNCNDTELANYFF